MCSIKKRQFWLIISIKINQLIVDLNFNGDNYSNICMNQCVAWCRHLSLFWIASRKKRKRKVPGIRLFMSVRLNLYGERSILHLLQHSKTKNNNLSSNAIFQRRCTMVHQLRPKWRPSDEFSIYQDRRSTVRLKSLATSSIDLQLNEVYFMQLFNRLCSFFFFFLIFFNQ